MRTLLVSKVLYSLGSCVLLFIFVRQYNYLSFHFISLALLACLLFPRYRRAIVVFSSMIVALTWGTPFSTVKYGGQVFSTPANFNLETFVGYNLDEIQWTGFSLLLTLVGMFSFRALIHRVRRSFNIGSIFLVQFLIFGLIYVLTLIRYESLNQDPVSQSLVMAIMGFINLSWYFMLYVHRPIGRTWAEKGFDILEAIPPPWTRTFEPRPLADLRNFIPKDETSLITMRSGFFLILRSMLVLYALDQIKIPLQASLAEQMNLGLTSNIYWRDFSVLYVEKFRHSSTWNHWIFFIFGTFHFLIQSHYGFAGIAIGVARALGIDLPVNTNRPWKARSFSDFCGRFLFYYNLVITNYFYVPFLKFTAKFGWSPKKRKVTALFLAIAWGGVVFHLFRDNYIFLGKPFTATFLKYLSTTLPFFIIFGVVCSSSEFLTKKRTRSGKAYDLIYFLWFLFIYALIYNLRYSHQLGFSETLAYYFHLLK